MNERGVPQRKGGLGRGLAALIPTRADDGIDVSVRIGTPDGARRCPAGEDVHAYEFARGDRSRMIVRSERGAINCCTSRIHMGHHDQAELVS